MYEVRYGSLELTKEITNVCYFQSAEAAWEYADMLEEQGIYAEVHTPHCYLGCVY